MAENIESEKERLVKMMRLMADDFEKSGRATGDYADAQSQAADKVKRSSDETKAALKQFGEQIGQSALSYGKALTTGGEGTAKFGTAIEGAGDAAFNLGKSFGLIGGVIGGIIKIFGGLASASLKQNDVMMKSYRDLSEMGSVSGTLEKVMSDFHKVGLTSEEAEKFGNMLRKVTPELSTFGGSVSLGKDKLVGVISGMIGPGNQIEKGMARIGYGADEMRDATADYIAKQSRLGLAQGKTEKELRDGSVKYMETLRELQELTGMSRDEAQKTIDANRNNAKYAMTLANMNEKEAAAVDNYMAAYRKRFGSQAADDLIEQFVNKGAIVGQASARASQSTLNQGYEQLENVRRGIIDSEKGIHNAGLAMSENYERLGSSIMVATDGLNDMTGDNAQKLGAMGESARKLSGIQQNLGKTMAISGDQLDKNVDIEQKNRQIRIAADNALMAVGNLVVNMFQKLNDMMYKFAKMLALMIDKFGVFVGLGKTNLSEGFRDQTDNAKDLQRARGKSIYGEGLVHQGVDNAAQDYKEAMAGNTDSLKKQMKEQENLTDKLKAQSKDEKLTPLERALAEERYKLEKKRYDAMDEEYGASKGFNDLNKVKEMRMKRLNDAMKAEADLKEQIKKLEEEKLRMSGGTGANAGAQGPIAGSPAYMAKFNAGGMAAAGYGGTKANENASGPDVSERQDLASLIKFIPGKYGTGDENHFRSLDPNVANSFVAMAAEYQKLTGKTLTVTSAYRSPDEQQKLKDDSDGKYPVADPGKSLHNVGRALDLDAAQIKQLQNMGEGAGNLLSKYGFQPLDKDPVHIQYGAKEGGIFDGPDSGYPVMLHGNEAVIPMPNLESFTESVKKENLNTMKSLDLTNRDTTTTQPVDNSLDIMNSMMAMMSNKFDEMIRHLDSSHSTQQQILTYTKA